MDFYLLYSISPRIIGIAPVPATRGRFLASNNNRSPCLNAPKNIPNSVFEAAETHRNTGFPRTPIARTVDMAPIRTRAKVPVSASVDLHGGDCLRHDNKEGRESLVANEKSGTWFTESINPHADKSSRQSYEHSCNSQQANK